MSTGKRHPLRDEAVAAIHAHLAVNGPKHWAPLVDRYKALGVNERIVRYWIAEAKKKVPVSPLLAAAKAAIQTVVAGREAALPEGVSEHLPATPSPNYISKTGERGLKQFDMILEIKKLYGDAEMLRAYAVKKTKDEEGNETELIKNPVAFDKSIARRANLLETSIRAVQEIWNLRTMQEFYEVVVQEIGRADQETQKRILTRLAVLNSKTGMSLSADF
jgi:hypothetical protein